MSKNEKDSVVLICCFAIVIGYLLFLKRQAESTTKFHEQMLDEYRLATVKKDDV